MDQMAAGRIVLLPTPRKLLRTTGQCTLGAFTCDGPGDFASAMAMVRGIQIESMAPGTLVHFSKGSFRPQGYQLSIEADRIAIVAADEVGAFYAAQTMVQLCRQFPDALPCLQIEDWPDFAARGVMLDISRDKVPTIATLTALIDMLAEWKINQLQLYTEHTFAYSWHQVVWKDASALTADEIRFLDEYCRARFIELVPNQNSFGHMERWLKHPAYEHLAEAIDGAETPWGFRWKGPFSLCPTDPASIKFLRGLYAELLPNFESKLFNVGCDETFDVGQGRSKAECERLGTTQVYLNFLRQVNELARSHGRRLMFWGDIIIHQPELIAQLPENVIAMEWGYEADHPFDRDGKLFADAAVPFYVCPGTSSWNCITGRSENCLANLKNAAENGLKHGAIGFLNTDWGDNGHLQYLPVSYLGFAAGAAYSWCLESNRDLDIARALNRHAFHDDAGILGQVAVDLGNVYKLCGKQTHNASALFRVLVLPPNDPNPEKHLTAESLAACEAAIDKAIAPLGQARSRRADGSLIAAEFCNAAAMLRYCVELARCRQASTPIPRDAPSAIATEHRRLWLARNRPGGLEDSVRRLTEPA